MTHPTITRRWNPWNDLLTLQEEVNRLFESSLQPSSRGALLASEYLPAVDVLKGEDEIVVKADLPGMKKEDLDVTVTNNRLFMRGEKKHECGTEEKKCVHRVERFFGRFERAVELPTPVDGERVTASFTDGVLEVHLPVRPEAKPRQITIEAR